MTDKWEPEYSEFQTIKIGWRKIARHRITNFFIEHRRNILEEIYLAHGLLPIKVSDDKEWIYFE